MTGSTGGNPLSGASSGDPLGALLHSATPIRAAVFTALRRGQPTDIAEIAAATGIPDGEVIATLDALERAGMAQRDAAGRVVAADGVALAPTAHQLVLDGVPLHTWCALDAVSIPVAVGADATAITHCGWCEQRRELRFTAGRLVGGHRAVVWLPAMTCTNVVEQFCPHANVFCDHTHLRAWHEQAGEPPGEALTLTDAAERAALVWRPLVNTG